MDDVSHLILSYLTFRDATALRCVCRELEDVAIVSCYNRLHILPTSTSPEVTQQGQYIVWTSPGLIVNLFFAYDTDRTLRPQGAEVHVGMDTRVLINEYLPCDALVSQIGSIRRLI
jgi:hypothetical protein